MCTSNNNTSPAIVISVRASDDPTSGRCLSRRAAVVRRRSDGNLRCPYDRHVLFSFLFFSFFSRIFIPRERRKNTFRRPHTENMRRVRLHAYYGRMCVYVERCTRDVAKFLYTFSTSLTRANDDDEKRRKNRVDRAKNKTQTVYTSLFFFSHNYYDRPRNADRRRTILRI